MSARENLIRQRTDGGIQFVHGDDDLVRRNVAAADVGGVIFNPLQLGTFENLHPAVMTTLPNLAGPDIRPWSYGRTELMATAGLVVALSFTRTITPATAEVTEAARIPTFADSSAGVS